jgi:HAMP domain-containing protein
MGAAEPSPSTPGPDRDDETIDGLRAEVARLKAEVARLRDELRRARRDQHEAPPHYL